MHQAAPTRATRLPRCGAANPGRRTMRCARKRSWLLLFLVVGQRCKHRAALQRSGDPIQSVPGFERPARRRRMLTPLQLQRYRDDGYLVLPGFKSAQAVRGLRERALAIVDAFDPAQGSGVFRTKDQAAASDAWFLGSACDVRCFFEAEAFDGDGGLRQPKAQSINKIGHALHELDPVFAAFSHGPELAELAADLGLRAPQLWQSMVIFKPPRIGGEVLWHRDATY